MRFGSRLRGISVATVVVALSIAFVPSAVAQVTPTVTLESSRERVLFGTAVRLSGEVAPPTVNETVSIVDDAGNVVTTAVTAADGSYAVRFTPRRNVRLHAEWSTATSDPVTIRVRPRLRIGMGAVRLFDTVVARGSLRPAHPGASIVVRLLRNGSTVARKSVRLRDGVYFRARFSIRKPGTFVARTRFDDADHLVATDRSARRTPPLPSLNVGSRNIYVRLLERRLADLNYHIRDIDRSYSIKTADAIRAFNKANGRVRVGSVSESTWRALASPRRPRPRFARPRYHLEVDQTKQLLYRVRRGRIITILHVSTGANGATRDGAFRFFREVNGYSGGRLYYPSYFDGLRATHGWPEVPTYPASHGCVRLPMWSAVFINGTISMGDRIFIYHS